MSRAIRRVPPNWKHPQDSRGKYIPLHADTFEKDIYEWIAADKAHDPSLHKGKSYEDCAGFAPRRENYANYKGQECTWWQAYEEVSEGTPCTPAFASKEELVEYLVESGIRGQPFQRDAAEKFVETGWIPSGIIFGGIMHSGAAAAKYMADHEND